MKKILVALCGIIFGCAGMYTQQELNRTALLNPGMTKQEVQSVLGFPAKSEFSDNVEVWHYCKTGYQTDEFVAVMFQDGKLRTSKNYTVSIAENGGIYGDCTKFIRQVDFRPADEVREIRFR